jgi:group I intron endonuclease
MKLIGIYKITSPTSKVYIGQSTDINKTWKYRYNNLNNRLKKQPKIYNSLLKYGIENHKFEVIEECSIEQLDERESYYKQQFINEFGWGKTLFCEIYDSNKGGYKSEETKHKQSISLTGRIISEETKQKMSKPKSFNPTRKSRSEESIKRQVLSKIGKLHSDKTKQKMSMSQKGKTRNKGRVLSEEHKLKLGAAIRKSKAVKLEI